MVIADVNDRPSLLHSSWQRSLHTSVNASRSHYHANYRHMIGLNDMPMATHAFVEDLVTAHTSATLAVDYIIPSLQDVA